MFKPHIDFLSIGDLTTDAFIRLKDANVHCKINHENCELCLRFGDKVPFEYVKVVRAVGNAANAAVTAARLNLHSALLTNIGGDENGHDCMMELKKNKVSTEYVKVHKNQPTNYHFVLWYESDRTILVNHIAYDYRLPVLPMTPAPKWIYLTSLASNTFPYHVAIADYLHANPKVKLAFQPGTFQIKLGVEELGRIYSRTDVLIVNLEEAQRILKTESRDIKTLLKGLAKFGPKIVLITDSTRGAYMFEGDHYYHIPMYPDPRLPFERTGCGDAFSATFVSALAMGKPPLEALMWAPINSMSVVQFVGSQEGLLTLEQLEWWLNRAPVEFRIREI
ncbi:MAG: carbohydrate kinase family protein [Candidatus Taylorbacteria bacterium]|nr:carbohydrate kinase family protein [Candidatus Taylorbacteria bacterium]